VTADIEALEDMLGTTLFDRRVQPVRTTAAAKVFRRHAVTTLLELQRCVEAAGEERERLVSRLRVGTCPGAGSAHFRSIMREFNAAHPGPVVGLVEADAASLGLDSPHGHSRRRGVSRRLDALAPSGVSCVKR
jgi:DNA-binding transcriptional LysR family regulator